MRKQMTYEEAMNVVVNSYRRGSKGGFGICARVLRELGDPHKKLRVIHIAGTNGKGSACAFLQRILNEAGHSVGMFTSPHLRRFNERFNINGADVCDVRFAELLSNVLAAFKKVFGRELYDDELQPSISYFELLTIMAFLYFYEENVDLAIMEAGLGGRLDATNIVPKPLISVITKISLDHTAQLGGSIPAIASEKGGIIKKSCPTVLFFQGEEVYNVIENMCSTRGSELYYPDDLETLVTENGVNGLSFTYAYNPIGSFAAAHSANDIDEKGRGFNPLRLSMFGGYQAYNAANVLCVIEVLNKLGYNIGDTAVRQGLLNARWAGRMEIVSEVPLVVLEGAHNPDGAEAAVYSMEHCFPGREITLVAGILKDKDYSNVINTLACTARNVILTQPAYSVRAVPPDELYRTITDKKKCAGVILDYRKALDTARSIAGETGVVFVSGSLYLVGDIKRYIEDGE